MRMPFSLSSSPALLLLLLLAMYGDVVKPVAAQCTQSGSCKCTSDEGTIDLTPIKGSSAQASFPDVPDASGGWFFSYSPCTPFTEGSQECKNVAVCQVSTDYTSTYPAGTVESATFGKGDDGSVQVSYTQTDSQGMTRTTNVKLQCDQGGSDMLNVQGEGTPGVYSMTLKSPHCCFKKGPGPGPSDDGSSGSISVGSILCIALLGVLFVYVMAGIAVQKGVRKATGREVFPNYTFWSALPGYIKDGVVFTFTGCKGSRHYDKL